MIEILATGLQATVQDAGRPGRAALGVPRSGAFDLPALRAANRLVGNDPDAAGVEFVLGGLRLIARRAVTVAFTGAVCPGVGWGEAVTLAAGTTLRMDAPANGLRSYLAVRGGVVVEPVLGSRATDTLSGLGPAPLTAGDVLTVGHASGEVSPAFVPPPAPVRALRLRLGPRDDWFADPAALFATTWTVRPQSDRIGVRLDGASLTRVHDGEIPSEPTLPGAVQVPGDGRPIVFGPDAPVTGGYPVIGVLDDLAAAAQLRPGDPVRFVRQDPNGPVRQDPSSGCSA